ncbi:helix-turn-helix domain-containing protein [Streptomyces sp. NPDC005722]
MIESFHTDVVPPDERAEFWTETVRSSFTQLEVSCHRSVALHGSLRRTSVGAIRVGHVEASAQRMARTPEMATADGVGALIVSLQGAGSSVAVQDGREMLLTAGQLLLLDTRRPFVRDFPGGVFQNAAVVPLELLDLPDAILLDVTGRTYPPEHYVAAILAAYVNRLATAAAAGSCVTGPKRFLQRGLVDVLTALATGETRRDVQAPGSGATLRLRVREYIRAHADEPGLTPATVAAAHHISVRYLHKLFQDEDRSVGRLIQHLRLEACRNDLERPDLAGLTVEAIAHRRGFGSHAHFSRAFRAAYGMSPVEWRGRAAGPGRPGGP